MRRAAVGDRTQPCPAPQRSRASKGCFLPQCPLRDTITLQLSGTVNGNQVTTTISGVNVAAAKADSRYLTDLINATSKTAGVSASTTGATGDIVLSSTTAGAGGTVGITATAATQSGDVAIFNNSDTLKSTVAGSNPATANKIDEPHRLTNLHIPASSRSREEDARVLTSRTR